MRPSFLSTGSVLAAPLFALGIVLVAGTVARLVDHLLRDAVGLALLAVLNFASAVIVLHLTRPVKRGARRRERRKA